MREGAIRYHCLDGTNSHQLKSCQFIGHLPSTLGNLLRKLLRSVCPPWTRSSCPARLSNIKSWKNDYRQHPRFGRKTISMSNSSGPGYQHFCTPCPQHHIFRGLELTITPTEAIHKHSMPSSLISLQDPPALKSTTPWPSLMLQS